MKAIYSFTLIFLVAGFCLISVRLLAGNGQLVFVTELNGDHEIPEVRTDATGFITFLLSEDFSEMEIHGVFSNITGNITGCQVYVGDRTTNGLPLLNLNTYISGKRLRAKIPVPSLFLQLATTGNLYVNIHSSVHPSGEIRGQLDWRSEIMMPVILLGASQIPPVPTAGIGLGVLKFSPNLTRLEYQIMPIGLSSLPIAASIHNGDANSNGRILANLNTGTFISGTITDQLTVIDVLFSVYDTGAYVNIKTNAFPDGEIRGQIVSPPLFNSSAFLNGDQEIPPVTTSARGFGYAVLNFPTSDSLYYIVISEGLNSTGGTLHQGEAGKSGTMISTLTPTGFPGVYSGVTAITADQLKAYMRDELYFNLSTASNPGGEIRGQFQNNLLDVYAFDLCGDQEMPKRNVPAYGAGYVGVNKAATELEYALHSIDLNGDALSAHIHDAPFGMNGAILVPLELPNPYATGVMDISGVVADKIKKDNAYFNVHTAAIPAGEMRGQIRRGLSCAINVSTTQSHITDLKILNNPVNDQLNIQIDSDRSTALHFAIRNLNGQCVQRGNFDLFAGQQVYSIHVEQLPAGFYWLDISENNISTYGVKFVKQD